MTTCPSKCLTCTCAPNFYMCFMQGPKHRVGMYPDGAKFALSKGQTYRFDLNKDQLGDGYRVSLPHPDVMAALEVGWGGIQSCGERWVEP